MITDQKIVKFCNEKLRRVADAQGSALLSTQAFLQEADAKAIELVIGGMIQAGVPADTVIDDGSSIDGRSPVTLQSVLNYITNSRSYLATATTTDPETQRTLLQDILWVAVNAKSGI